MAPRRGGLLGPGQWAGKHGSAVNVCGCGVVKGRECFCCPLASRSGRVPQACVSACRGFNEPPRATMTCLRTSFLPVGQAGLQGLVPQSTQSRKSTGTCRDFGWHPLCSDLVGPSHPGLHLAALQPYACACTGLCSPARPKRPRCGVVHMALPRPRCATSAASTPGLRSCAVLWVCTATPHLHAAVLPWPALLCPLLTLVHLHLPPTLAQQSPDPDRSCNQGG